VPRDAVLDRDGSTGHVFLAAGDKAEERKVTIGIENLHELEITSGLQKGDKIVTVGQATLQNGDKITLPSTASR
jgi:multidrug efflux pump subunit AcrA (membrane-fusion protein)